MVLWLWLIACGGGDEPATTPPGDDDDDTEVPTDTVATDTVDSATAYADVVCAPGDPFVAGTPR